MKNHSACSWLLTALALFFTLSCIFIVPPHGDIKFSPDILPDGVSGVPYEVHLSISGNVTPVDAFSISEGSLPPGLKLENLEDRSARLVGTPQTAGTYHFTVFVFCLGTNVSGQQGEQAYSLTIKP